MEIITLMDNRAREGFISEHGLSLLIRVGTKQILFDMGQSDAFAGNAQKMGIDLRAVDIAILSHGHYDHGGGLARFLELNDTATVYVSGLAFSPYYNGEEKYIGLDASLQSNRRLKTVRGDTEIARGITIRQPGRIALRHPSFGQGLRVMRAGSLMPDDFAHEQYLQIEEGRKTVLISGCAHRGALNLIELYRPDVLIGGLHFMKLNPDGEELGAQARALGESGVRIYTGHCTGEKQFDALKAVLGGRISYLAAGDRIEI